MTKMKKEMEETKEKLTKVEEELAESKDTLVKVEKVTNKIKKDNLRLYKQHEKLKDKHDNLVNQEQNVEQLIKNNTELEKKLKESSMLLARALRVNETIIENNKTKGSLADKKENEIIEIEVDDKDHIVKCPVCDFSTKNKQHSKGHMTKHKKRNSFNCTKCTKKFAQESALKQHMNAQHKATAKPPVGHS